MAATCRLDLVGALHVSGSFSSPSAGARHQVESVSLEGRSRTPKGLFKSVKSIQDPRLASRSRLSVPEAVAAAEAAAPSAATAIEAGDEILEITETEIQVPVEWNPATVLSTRDLAPGVRIVTVHAEISREFVELEKAYRRAGQTVEIRIPGGSSAPVVASSPPFSENASHAVLLKVRGDISAGSTKAAAYTMSVRTALELHVEEAGHPELFAAATGSTVEIGPFSGGVELKTITFVAKYQTVLVFAKGRGVAAARALVEAKDNGSLYLRLRENVRLYISAPDAAGHVYQEFYDSFRARGVTVVPVVDGGEAPAGFGVGSLTDAFDRDDFEYNSNNTAVVVFGDKATIEEVQKLSTDGGIPLSQVASCEV